MVAYIIKFYQSGFFIKKVEVVLVYVFFSFLLSGGPHQGGAVPAHPLRLRQDQSRGLLTAAV